MTIIHNARHIVIPAMAGLHVAVPRRTSAAGGWWVVAGKTCVAAYAPKGAASLAASYTNLANPGTYDATAGFAPSFDAATGWTFAPSKYLNTGYTPDANTTVLVRFTLTFTGGTQKMCGELATGANLCFVPESSGSYCVFFWGSGYLILEAGSRISSGVMCLAGPNAYIDGVSKGVISGSWTGTPTQIRIGPAENTNWFIGAIQAMVIYSDTLTAGEVSTLSGAMAAL